MSPLCVAVEWGVFGMARLIDAESPQNRIYVSDLVIEEMKKIPTVDIVLPTRSQFKRMAVQLWYEAVVHCKDCKHSWEDIGGLCCSHGVCVDCTVPVDFFCAYGEMRADFVDDNKIGERRADE